MDTVVVVVVVVYLGVPGVTVANLVSKTRITLCTHVIIRHYCDSTSPAEQLKGLKLPIFLFSQVALHTAATLW